MTDVGDASFVVAAVLAMLAFVQFGLRSLYGYALTSTRFEVRLFGRIPVYTIPFADMTGIETWHMSFADLGRTFVTLRLGNRIIGPGVAIERRGRFPRYVIVTPDDAHAMLADLRERIVNS